MTRPLAFLLLALLAPAAAAQSISETATVADSAGAAAGTSAASSRSDSLAAGAAARRAAEGTALDSLLAAHPDVLADHLARREAAQPWWRRWWPLSLGLLALAGLGLAVAAFLRAGRVGHEVAALAAMPSDGGPAARTATQAAARADAAVAALSSSVTARLGDVERTRAAVAAQITQTANLLDRAERLGLFQGAFAAAVAPPPMPAETPDELSIPEPSAE